MKPIEIKNLKFGYTKDRIILDDVSLEFESNNITSVLGPNGSGKTTMLKLILGLMKPVAGDIFILGTNLKEIPLRERAKLLAYVPQKHNAVFDYKVIDVCAMGRAAYSGVFSSVSKKDLDIAMNSLEKMRISHLAEKPYTQISGGEQQMVLIARALTQQAKILILDEPVTGLDYGNQIRLLKTLRELAQEGITCIKTTHYPEHALWTSGQAVFMRNGKVLASGLTSEIVNSDNLRAIYDTEIIVLDRPINDSSVSTCVPIL
jgi:iron complex transport system ATP-binding protein